MRFDQAWTGVPHPQQQPYQAPPQQLPSTPHTLHSKLITLRILLTMPLQNQSWYMDSGATNHVTSDLGNLSLKSEYRGDNRLAGGNGQQLGQGNEEGATSRSTSEGSLPTTTV
ncbi:hypothetical protein ACOSP7_030206 [Xanthoceras sorbifolium]